MPDPIGSTSLALPIFAYALNPYPFHYLAGAFAKLALTLLFRIRG
jgi:hypothetical protein